MNDTIPTVAAKGKASEVCNSSSTVGNRDFSKKKKAKFARIDKELHWLIICSCDNKRLQELFFQIYDFVMMSQHMVRKIDNYLDEHIALIETMLRGNIEKAQRILEMHINNAKNEVTKMLKMNS